MDRIRVAACQVNTVVGDLSGNVARILAALDEAERGGADLAVFPELTVTGYPPEDLLGRPSFVDDNLAALAEVAASTRACAAVVGYVDRDAGGRLFNAAALCARRTDPRALPQADTALITASSTSSAGSSPGAGRAPLLRGGRRAGRGVGLRGHVVRERTDARRGGMPVRGCWSISTPPPTRGAGARSGWRCSPSGSPRPAARSST